MKEATVEQLQEANIPKHVAQKFTKRFKRTKADRHRSASSFRSHLTVNKTVLARRFCCSNASVTYPFAVQTVGQESPPQVEMCTLHYNRTASQRAVLLIEVHIDLFLFKQR